MTTWACTEMSRAGACHTRRPWGDTAGTPMCWRWPPQSWWRWGFWRFGYLFLLIPQLREATAP